MLGGDDGVRVGGAVQPEHVRGHCVATNMLVAHVPAKTARAQYIGGMVSSKAESPSICPQEVGAADGDAVSTGQTISKLKRPLMVLPSADAELTSTRSTCPATYVVLTCWCCEPLQNWLVVRVRASSGPLMINELSCSPFCEKSRVWHDRIQKIPANGA